MPTIPVGYASAEYQFRMVGDNELMLSTIGLKLNAPATVDLANQLMGTFRTPFATQLATNLKLVGVKLTAGDDGDPLVFQSTNGELGFTGGGSLPQNCAFLLRKLTGLGGRRNRGRMYIPGVNDNLVDELGVVTSAGLATLQTAASTFLTSTLALAVIDDAVILHTPTVETPLPTVITTLVVDGRIATQRRRLRP